MRRQDSDGGKIVKMYRITATGSKTGERKTFKARRDYTNDNTTTIDGPLLYKVDRGGRNPLDYVEL
jgi:site-specific DNA recombinase